MQEFYPIPVYPSDQELALVFLAYAASAYGAGVLASWLFDRLRELLPRPTRSEWASGSPEMRAVWLCLYAPRRARLAVWVLTLLIALTAHLTLAILAGEESTSTILLWAVVSVLVGQWRHAQQHLNDKVETI